jgi:NAD-dependent dihydropyrimidine dehydrogenase PreA subunit
MALRNIVKIDEAKCTGCGQCVNACAEGAIQIIDGKAKLVSEVYCDGLGACLGHCPENAITIEQREAAEFDEEGTKARLAQPVGWARPTISSRTEQTVCNAHPTVCPGLAAHRLRDNDAPDDSDAGAAPSQLSHWPVQLELVSPAAPYFADADLLLVADCVPFAMGDFHRQFLRDHSVAVGCPKLDDAGFYVDKLADILRSNTVRSLTVVHMEVPCCSGLTRIAREALVRAAAEIPFEDVTIGLRGDVVRREKVNAAAPAQA